MDISRATLAFWMIQVGKALVPLIVLLEEALLSGKVIHMDETPVQGKSKGSGKVHLALSEIQKLYVIESQIAGKPADEKQAIRQARAGPTLSKMRGWSDKSRTQVPPKGALGKALAYLDGEWNQLIRYVDDGRLPLDNNPCENAIRPFVIGRKIGCSHKARPALRQVPPFTR